MGDWLEIVGVAVGLVYLYLEYKASIWLWVVSIIMPAIYLAVFYGAGLYADTAINIYYLVIAIYGFICWRRGKGDGNEQLQITHASKRVWVAMLLLYIAAHAIFSTTLIVFTDSDVPIFNGLTSALSVVGMWMLARKYIEQWIVWIVVDLLSAGLYFYKDLEATALLYALYAVIAVFGYRKWLKMMKQDA